MWFLLPGGLHHFPTCGASVSPSPAVWALLVNFRSPFRLALLSFSSLLHLGVDIRILTLSFYDVLLSFSHLCGLLIEFSMVFCVAMLTNSILALCSLYLFAFALSYSKSSIVKMLSLFRHLCLATQNGLNDAIFSKEKCYLVVYFVTISIGKSDW